MSETKSTLSAVGVGVCALGLLGLFFFLAVFDTSVEVPPRGSTETRRVNNIGLMGQQQSGIIVSGAVLVIGALLLVAGRVGRSQTSEAIYHGIPRRRNGAIQCPVCRLLSPDTAVRCDCGFMFDKGVRVQDDR